VGCVGGELVVAAGLVDEVVDDEDEDVSGDEGGRSQGDVAWWPQPVVAAPTIRVAAAQPTTVTRASSMGIPFHVNLRAKCRHPAVRPRRLTLTRNASANKSSADEPPCRLADERRFAAYAGVGQGNFAVRRAK
jgi:hypothetical protein